MRKRPGMYIGGTDERALHHLVAEVLDNSMDEAVAGHANRIEVELHADYSVTIRDNGRGIPVDPHPKFPDKSALEVILCTLHAGGKFSGKAYQTSGGLHGVGASVVNALSDSMVVEVARNRELYEQRFARGIPLGPIAKIGATPNRRGTSVTFHADEQIFGKHRFKPARLFATIRSKAYLFSGVEIRWKTKLMMAKHPVKRRSVSPADCRIILSRPLEKPAPMQTPLSPVPWNFKSASMCPARLNGRSIGHRHVMALSNPIVTPFPRVKAVPMKAGSGPQS